MLISGILLFFVGIIVVVLMITSFQMSLVPFIVFDWPTSIFLFISIASVIIATNGLKLFKDTLKSIIYSDFTLPENDKVAACRLFKTIKKSVYNLMLIVVALGTLTLLTNLSPDTFGSYLILPLHGVLQCACLNFIIINPILYYLEKQ